MSRNQHQIAYSLFLACCFIIIKGYLYNTGDLCEHLPPVYKLMDPELYPKDFFMTLFEQTFTVRQYYIWFVYGLSLLIPIDIACFTLVLLCVFISIYSWMEITRYFTDQKLAPYITPLLIFFVFYSFTIGSNMIQYNMLACSALAKALVSFGLLLYLKNRYRISFFILAIATLFQLMAGLQMFMILGIILLINYKKTGFKEVVISVMIYVVFASFILVPVVYRQIFTTFNYDKELYNKIMFGLRNPHHFLPSSFPISDYLKYAGLLALGVFSFLKSKLSFEGKAFILTFVAIQIGILISYILGVEIFHNFSIAKFQWFKTTIWTGALCSTIISIFISEKLSVVKLNPKKFSIIFIIGAVIILLVITNSKWLPLEKLRTRYMVGNYQKGDLTKMHEWINLNTNKSAVFLTLPIDAGFSCESKRSTPVSPIAMVHEPFYGFPWYETMNEYYGITLENCKGKHYLKVSQENYSNEFKDVSAIVQYRIDNKKECKYVDKLGVLIHVEGDYILTKVGK
jgi:hypothetical protein